MPEKKNQHYVSAFLLRRFSPDRASVGAYLLRPGKLIPTAGISGQCAKDYFYGHESHMEDAFAESEGRVASMLGPLAPEHLETLKTAGYTAGEITAKGQVRALADAPLYRLREFIYYQAHRTAAVAEASDDLFERFAKERLSCDPAFQVAVARDPKLARALETCSIKQTEPISNVLWAAGPNHYVMLDLEVKFLVASNLAPPFLLSDNPVVVRNQYVERHQGRWTVVGSLGMPARGLQMYLPLSPRVTAVVYDPAVYAYGSPQRIWATVGANDVRLLNSMQALGAQHCLYVNPKELEVAEVELERCRSIWAERPESGPQVLRGELRENGDGTFSQTVIHAQQQPQLERHLSCVRVANVPPTFMPVHGLAGVLACPIRSPALVDFAEGLRRYLDMKMKTEIVERGLPVHPDRQAWLDGIPPLG